MRYGDFRKQADAYDRYQNPGNYDSKGNARFDTYSAASPERKQVDTTQFVSPVKEMGDAAKKWVNRGAENVRTNNTATAASPNNLYNPRDFDTKVVPYLVRANKGQQLTPQQLAAAKQRYELAYRNAWSQAGAQFSNAKQNNSALRDNRNVFFGMGGTDISGLTGTAGRGKVSYFPWTKDQNGNWVRSGQQQNLTPWTYSMGTTYNYADLLSDDPAALNNFQQGMANALMSHWTTDQIGRNMRTEIANNDAAQMAVRAPDVTNGALAPVFGAGYSAVSGNEDFKTPLQTTSESRQEFLRSNAELLPEEGTEARVEAGQDLLNQANTYQNVRDATELAETMAAFGPLKAKIGPWWTTAGIVGLNQKNNIGYFGARAVEAATPEDSKLHQGAGVMAQMLDSDVQEANAERNIVFGQSYDEAHQIDMMSQDYMSNVTKEKTRLGRELTPEEDRQMMVKAMQHAIQLGHGETAVFTTKEFRELPPDVKANMYMDAIQSYGIHAIGSRGVTGLIDGGKVLFGKMNTTEYTDKLFQEDPRYRQMLDNIIDSTDEYTALALSNMAKGQGGQEGSQTAAYLIKGITTHIEDKFAENPDACLRFIPQYASYIKNGSMSEGSSRVMDYMQDKDWWAKADMDSIKDFVRWVYSDEGREKLGQSKGGGEVMEKITGAVKDGLIDKLKDNPLMLNQVASIWLYSKGMDTLGDFAGNPLLFYGTVALTLVGGTALLGSLLSGGSDDDEKRSDEDDEETSYKKRLAAKVYG